MAEPLKHVYSSSFIGDLGRELRSIKPAFDVEIFTADVFGSGWNDLELKGRMRRIAISIRNQMNSFEDGVEVLIELSKIKSSDFSGDMNFEYMFIPDYVEVYGVDNPTVALKSMPLITKYTSCEFAVRPFILADHSVLGLLETWATDPDYRVRRLASEGCRPRLPWAMALPFLKKDPQPILGVLNMLCGDDSLFVRRSVANNINDISKDNPEIAMDICKGMVGESAELNWVAKHALRGLLKAGNREALLLFGFGSPDTFKTGTILLETDKVTEGDSLAFSFSIDNKSHQTAKVRLEYMVYYMKANGKQRGKVFQISETNLKAGEQKKYDKRHAFKSISTRKHYKGAHAIALIVNGEERAQVNFELC